MTYQEMYQEKLVTAEEAVKIIESGQWIDYGFCTGMPRSLDLALAKRLEEEPDFGHLNLRSGIALWDMAVTKVTDAKERLNWNSWHSSAMDRKIFKRDLGYYSVLRYSELPRYYRENIRHTDVLMIQTAPMDEDGYFNFGPNASHLAAAIECADTIIVEVNENMPVCLGREEAAIHIHQIDMIVEGENPPMAEVQNAKITEVDEAIARLILPEIPDGACLQLGIGGMPNVMGKLIAQSDLKDLGIHTEVYVDSMMEMTEAGKITGIYKNCDPGRQVYTFAMGTKKLYEYMHQNPQLLSAPVDYVNDVRRIAAIDNFMSINNAIEVDLFGQVASESVGFRHVSGAGGQLDFVLGSYLSKGGKSFICLSSTVKDKEGNRKSRLRPGFSPGSIVTCTRANVHYLVTEYGIVNLKGTTTWQRAEKMISIAHPDFRDELIREAEKMGVWCPSNKR